jgi:4-hydroxy-3-methylbut-2-enyl diphosphate reductase IspH
VSSKSRESCDEKRLKKKQKKHMIRKEKRRIAKQTKEKFQNITNFVNELHNKEPHTKRKTLICELTQHLY